jgi:hypothetical protein
MTPSYKELITVLENSQSVASIGLTEKRVSTMLSALRMADALTNDEGTHSSVVLAIPHQRIADMVSCALDTPAGDWLVKATTGAVTDRSAIATTSPWYSQGAYWAQPDAAILCTVENPANDHSGWNLTKRLTLEDFKRALALMATKDNGAYARHFGDFLGENEDAATGDLFMQLAVYGEEVFA